MAFKDLFIPKLVDNSPKGWVRFAGQTAVQSAATTAGLYGGLLLVAAAYALWESRINELKEENARLEKLILSK